MKNLNQLNGERIKLIERIKQIENDLHKGLKQDPDANAQEEGDREVLSQLYEIEKQNLKRVEIEMVNL